MSRTWTLPGALCVLAGLLAALAPTGAIFSDSGWITPAVTVIVLVSVTGAVFRLLPRVGGAGLAIAAQAVVTFLALPFLCAPESLAGGLVPTPGSYGTVAGGVSDGFGEIFSTAVPVTTTTGFTTLLVIGLALVAMLVDALALDLRQEKAAALVLLAQLALPALLAGADVGWSRFAATAVGFVLVLLSRPAMARPWRMPSAAVAVGVLAVVAAVALPSVLPIVPDSHRRTLGTGDLKVTNPFLDLRKDLADRSDDPLLEYKTNAKSPEPLRLTSVTAFNGRTWQPEDFTLSTRNAASDGLPATEEIRSGETASATTQITVRDLTGSYLPAPYAPSTVRDAGDGWIYDPKTLTMVSHDGLKADSTYTIDSITGTPSQKQLRQASGADKSRYASELELPDSLPDSVSNTAKRVTSGASDNWERAAKIQAYLRSDRFSYSLDAPAVASGNSIADFLREKKGYCVQFSATMAVMSRSLGIPARIGVGYTPGTQDEDGSYTVTSRDAHAWPELYFPGYGWTRFEPTPGGTVGTPPPWTGASQDDSGSTPTPSASTSAAQDSDESGATDEPEPTASASTADTSDSGAEDAGQQPAVPRWVWWSGAAVLIVVLVLLVPGAIRRAQRSRRLGSASAVRQWREFTALLTDFAQIPETSDTITHTAKRLARLTGDDEAVTRLAASVEAGRYGPPSASRSRRDAALQHDSPAGLEPGEARQTADSVRAGLKAESSWPRRVRATLLPPSLFHRK